MRARRGLRIGLGTLVGVLVISACSGVPERGPVERAPDVSQAESSLSRFVPAGPAADASPRDLVLGYVESMLGFPSDPQISAAFLTDEAAERWRPSARTLVYESIVVEAPEPTEEAEEATARVEVSAIGMLDDNGRFGYQESNRQLRLELARRDGQWRIANPPQGLLLSERYFEENVRPAEVFFLDATGERLVGDPVHVIDDDRAATRLVTAVLNGPDDVRSADVQTFAPDDQSLRGEVEVTDDGVAEVRFRQAIASLEALARERLIAQITATLLQLDAVDSVRVIAPGTDVVATAASIAELRPPARPSDVYAVREERLVRLEAGEVVPLEEPWDELDLSGREISVDASTERIALLGGDEVEVRELATGDSVLAVDAPDVVAAVWDVDGVLWIVDREPDEGLRVRVVLDDEVVQADASAWTMADVESFDLSPDGVRYALVSRTTEGQRRVLSGPVLREPDGAVIGVGDAEVIGVRGLADVASVLWVTSSDIALIARAQGLGLQPLVIRQDGWSDPSTVADRPALPASDAQRSVVLRPRSGDVYVESDDGVWAITASRPWELLEDVRSPVRAH